MCQFATIFVGLALFMPIFAGSTVLHTIEKYDGKTSGRHVIQLKSGVSKAKVFRELKGNFNITHDWDLIHAFAGNAYIVLRR